MRTLYKVRPSARATGVARGFTMVEVLVVMLILLVAAAMAIPGYGAIARYFRIAGDIRDMNGIVAQAKMRAAADFTHARVHANLNTNTYSLEVWDKAANSGAGCWKTEGDSVNQCTASTSPVQSLSAAVTFGFGNATASAPNPQSPIGQAPTCTTGVAGGAAGSTLPNTACIEFNSRGLPVAASGSPTANDALYITDSSSVYGVTVIVSGLIQIWTTTSETGGSTVWAAR